MVSNEKEAKHLTHACVMTGRVDAWVNESKTLPGLLTH